MDFNSHIMTAWSKTLEFIVPLILSTLVLAVVSTLSLGILAPVMFAGYLHSILLMLREDREPKIKDLFSKMNLFLPLLIFGIIVVVVAIIGLVLLLIPGIVFILAVLYFCLYMMPLMIDKNLGLLDAIKKSIAMVKTGPKLDHIVILVLFIGLGWLGSLVVVGWLFTEPLSAIFLMSAYLEKVKIPASSV